MSLLRDIHAVAADKFERVDRSLEDIERRISIAGASVDEWTLGQTNEFRRAALEIRRNLDEIHASQSKLDESMGYSKLRAEMLNIEDLRRAVSAFDQFVSKWVR